MEKILCIIARMDAGGAETMLMKMYRTVDKEKYQFDFVTYVKGEGVYDKEIIEKGGKLYSISPLKQKTFQCFYELFSIIRNNNYKHVIISIPFSVYSLMLVVAKLAGAKRIGLRCTNTKVGDGRFLYTVLHKLFMPLANWVTDVKLAPSKIAAEWMFGKRCIENGTANILNNGLPLQRFYFSEGKRNKLREEFKIEEKLVFGHVGRFVYQKNHRFLIDVFFEIKKIRNNAILLLLGTGMCQKEIEEYIEELGLSSSVIIAGVRNDVSDVLMAMDELIFPSFYEGMPNVVIESQCTGLPCIISDTITQDARATDIVRFKSLEDNAYEWAIDALEHYEKFKSINRRDYNKQMDEAGYDIKDVTNNFINYMIK